jgi:hypothetical protein
MRPPVVVTAGLTTVALLAAVACTRQGNPPEKATAANVMTMAIFQPVPLPDPRIEGFSFPETEEAIVGWTKSNDEKKIDLHAWGIWTALTQETSEEFEGQTLRVFETWADPSDLEGPSTTAELSTKPRNPRPLQPLRQVGRHGPLRLTALGTNETTVLGFVKYDPSAADFIATKGLLTKLALNQLLQSGASAVPDFPPTALSLKPVFQTLASNQLTGGRYFRLQTWPGSPALKLDPATAMWDSKPFPPDQWGQCVWIDVQNAGTGPGTGGVDGSCSADGASRTDASTYGVGNFINFQLTAADADVLNQGAKANRSPAVLRAGDYSVLLAMHVTSREITRWTWQTFWWLPDPDKATTPSSVGMVAARPAELQGSARHYAACAAYQELKPLEPNTGGSNTGESVYCFNPYLEAPFASTDLPQSQPGMTHANGKLVKTANHVGAQTNCMSCHEQANYNPNGLAKAPDYTGARYVDLNSPQFKGTLKLDFLWSLTRAR